MKLALLILAFFLPSFAMAWECPNRYNDEEKLRLSEYAGDVKLTSLYFTKYTQYYGKKPENGSDFKILIANGIVMSDGKNLKKGEAIKVHMGYYESYHFDYAYLKKQLNKPEAIMFGEKPFYHSLCQFYPQKNTLANYLQKRKELEAKAPNSLELAQFYSYWGDKTRAKEIADFLLEKGHDKFTLAKIYLEIGDFEKAKKLFEVLQNTPAKTIMSAYIKLQAIPREYKNRGITNEIFTSDFSDADFKDVNLSLLKANNQFNLSHLNAPKSDWSHVKLRNLTFENANLEGANFSNASFENVNLENANLTRAKMQGVTFKNVSVNCGTQFTDDFNFNAQDIIFKETCGGKYSLDFTAMNKIAPRLIGVNLEGETLKGDFPHLQGNLKKAHIILGKRPFYFTNNSTYKNATIENISQDIVSWLRDDNQLTLIGQEMKNNRYQMSFVLKQKWRISRGNDIKNLRLHIDFSLNGKKTSDLLIHEGLENLQYNKFENVDLSCDDKWSEWDDKKSKSVSYQITALDKVKFNKEWGYFQASVATLKTALYSFENVKIDPACAALLAKVEGN